ncbi:MAG: glycoside hydrolase family 76 protein, partial [Bacteroidales bacterium]|nr:glycoside hydrolase family 76 protein [Bacteroidales bacterium]
DMMGGDDTGGKVVYETVDGVEYRRHTNLKDRVGPAHSYNSGAILSGAADLYRVTGDNAYLTDIQRLTDASFKYFAKPDETVEGLYTYDFSGNNSWFNAVLLRGYIDAYPAYNGAALPVDTFQQVYDHAYDNFLYEGMMPNSLYLGWANDRTKRTVRGRDQFAYAAQFALLAKYELEN